MFIGFSKTIARLGGFRLGIGLRMTKQNAAWFWLILMFVVMFKLMWYLLILCGWIMYALIYSIYWCIKKIICSIIKHSKKKPASRIPNPKPSKNKFEEKEEHTIMSTEQNNTSKNNPKKQTSNKVSTIIRWIIGGFFSVFVLANGFHFSSLFLSVAAFLMFPFPFMKTFLQSKNIKTSVAIILSVIFLFTGIMMSPQSDSSDVSLDDSNETTDNLIETTNENISETQYINSEIANSSETEDVSGVNNDSVETEDITEIDSSSIETENDNEINSSFVETDDVTEAECSSNETENITEIHTNIAETENSNQTMETETLVSDEGKQTMVWVTSNGKKYHSDPNCSNMKSPKQITKEDAQKQGYDPCSKCH